MKTLTNPTVSRKTEWRLHPLSFAKSKRRGAELAEDFAERIGGGLLDACYFPDKMNYKSLIINVLNSAEGRMN
jgi:hypothetical protein